VPTFSQSRVPAREIGTRDNKGGKQVVEPDKGHAGQRDEQDSTAAAMTRLAEAEDGAGRHRAEEEVRHIEGLDVPAGADPQPLHRMSREDDDDHVAGVQKGRRRKEKDGCRVIRLVLGALDLELLGDRGT